MYPIHRPALKTTPSSTHSLRVPLSQWDWARRQFRYSKTYEHLPLDDGSRTLRLYGVAVSRFSDVLYSLREAHLPFDGRYADGRFTIARFFSDGQYRFFTWNSKPDTVPPWENQEDYRKLWQTLQLLNPE